MSSNFNPFRHQQELPPSPPLPPIPPPDKLPAIPPPQSPSATAGSASQSEMPTRHIPPSSQELIGIIEEDLPPPYTPAANAGEETVSLGPRRPFQQPPPLPPSSLHPSPSGNWSPSLVLPNGPSPRGPYAPPPSDPPGLAPWQMQQQYRRRPSAGGGLIGALFDTVRDIADVVSGAHDERAAALRSTNASAYAAPYSGTQPAYAPPPVPPPPSRPASAPPHSPPPIPDNGSPTRTPVPGHPLLLNGRLLIYPRDHLCVKCRNTGYKDYDPSHPCRRCWDKYGRPYNGALSYTSWSPSQNDPRMQRPLPRFIPPHLAASSPGSYSGQPSTPPPPCGLFPPPPRHPHHSRSISNPHRLPPQGSEVSYYVANPLSPRHTPPVPNAVAVQPGDPRLGGRLCIRCRGAGVQSLLFFDVLMCDCCGGTGRVWT